VGCLRERLLQRLSGTLERADLLQHESHTVESEGGLLHILVGQELESLQRPTLRLHKESVPKGIFLSNSRPMILNRVRENKIFGFLIGPIGPTQLSEIDPLRHGLIVVSVSKNLFLPPKDTHLGKGRALLPKVPENATRKGSDLIDSAAPKLFVEKGTNAAGTIPFEELTKLCHLLRWQSGPEKIEFQSGHILKGEPPAGAALPALTTRVRLGRMTLQRTLEALIKSLQSGEVLLPLGEELDRLPFSAVDHIDGGQQIAR